MTPRQLVKDTLEFKNSASRAPRQLWLLPWAQSRHPEMVERLNREFAWDIASPAVEYAAYPPTQGNAYERGEFVDEWGCRFVNINPGYIGEVKRPQILEDDWSDAERVSLPEGWLSFDIEQVNRACAASDRFLLSGCCPRPFEQLQFLRGTANLYMDLMDMPSAMCGFLERMHDFYCRLMTKWAETDVDALYFMDDWGSQRGLLIHPALWKKVFYPMYRAYADIAHSHGKKLFMHSDGDTYAILPDLVDMGLDAMNAQLFCIGLDRLKDFRGKLCFWGEIDRQQLLPYASVEEIGRAVARVHDTLWQDGGCIAQCEFGPGARPENVYEVFRAWDRLTGGGE